eukprot:CFRG4977T1
MFLSERSARKQYKSGRRSIRERIECKMGTKRRASASLDEEFSLFEAEMRELEAESKTNPAPEPISTPVPTSKPESAATPTAAQRQSVIANNPYPQLPPTHPRFQQQQQQQQNQQQRLPSHMQGTPFQPQSQGLHRPGSLSGPYPTQPPQNQHSHQFHPSTGYNVHPHTQQHRTGPNGMGMPRGPPGPPQHSLPQQPMAGPNGMGMPRGPPGPLMGAPSQGQQTYQQQQQMQSSMPRPSVGSAYPQPPSAKVEAPPSTYSAAPTKIVAPAIGPKRPDGPTDSEKKDKPAPELDIQGKQTSETPAPAPSSSGTGIIYTPALVPAGPIGPMRPPQMMMYGVHAMPPAMSMSAQTLPVQEESKDLTKEQKKLAIRHAGGRTWNDSKLAEWDKDDYVIFVGDLGNDANDEMLARCFSHFDSYQRARVVADTKTGKTRGYGFVSFKDVACYTRAMREMNGKYCGNRPMKLKRSSWQQRSYSVKKQKGEIKHQTKRLK